MIKWNDLHRGDLICGPSGEVYQVTEVLHKTVKVAISEYSLESGIDNPTHLLLDEVALRSFWLRERAAEKERDEAQKKDVHLSWKSTAQNLQRQLAAAEADNAKLRQQLAALESRVKSGCPLREVGDE